MQKTWEGRETKESEAEKDQVSGDKEGKDGGYGTLGEGP